MSIEVQNVSRQFGEYTALEGVNLKIESGELYVLDLGPAYRGYFADNCRVFAVNGEPTDLRLGAATRGCFRVRLTASGKAAHSGYPELGESAIEKLLDCLVALRSADWPSDPLLGKTHYTVGLIHGGVAPNVVPPNAEAEVFFRTVGDHAPLRVLLHKTLAGRVDVKEILELPAARMHTVAGFETAVFSYFSDVPFLSNWGTPLLLGPGSIHVAHTDREHIAIAELDRAVDTYALLASTLLSA